jgi:TRAP-type mannitol/chloroaromatic compound transport system permease small subunit
VGRLLARSRPGHVGAGWGMQTFLLTIDRISALIGKIGAWCIVVLSFAVGYEVVARYVFRAPTTWAYDMSYMLYGALFMLAGAYTLSRNGHVRGDFLYRSFRPRLQAGLDLALYFLFFFPGILALVYSGYGYAKISWLIGERSSVSPFGPPIYHFKTLIPVAGCLMLLQGIAEVIRCLVCLKTGQWPQRLSDVEELEKVILEKAQHDQQAQEPGR